MANSVALHRRNVSPSDPLWLNRDTSQNSKKGIPSILPLNSSFIASTRVLSHWGAIRLKSVQINAHRDVFITLNWFSQFNLETSFIFTYIRERVRAHVALATTFIAEYQKIAWSALTLAEQL